MTGNTRSKDFFSTNTCFEKHCNIDSFSVPTCIPPMFEKENCYEMIRLPTDFRPGPFDVICGRGKDVLQHPGNLRYRELVNASLKSYNTTKSKLEKTLLVSAIIKLVEDACCEGGGFVKKINGVWYKVSEKYAREKCGQRSSSRAKAGRRKCHFQDYSIEHSTSSRMTVSQTDDLNEIEYEHDLWQPLDHSENISAMDKPFTRTIGAACPHFLSNQWIMRDNFRHRYSSHRSTIALPSNSTNNSFYQTILTEKRLVSPMVSTQDFRIWNGETERVNEKLKSVLKDDLEDPDGLDWMVQSMVWED